jgi:mannose-1-phosphate guanylyltransferase/mannose-6-phosphate isomerase
MIQVTPVILWAGSGIRLLPLLRTGFLKQFLGLTGNERLFQQAAQRLAVLSQKHIQLGTTFIVSDDDYRLKDEYYRKFRRITGFKPLAS